MDLAELDYDLPSGLIAQHPLADRAASRLMVVRREQGGIEHRQFVDVESMLAPSDLLVLNDARVVPARLFARRPGTGGLVEILVLQRLTGAVYLAITGSGGRLVAGEMLKVSEDERGVTPARLEATLIEKQPSGAWTIALRSPEGKDIEAEIRALGRMPLPPYIKRERFGDAFAAEDAERYQTVYASREGAAAAPTAGLHFTKDLLDRLRARGVAVATLTLHVGPGTFKPVKSGRVEDHILDAERYELPQATADAIAAARARGGRIVAAGTTTTRVLESVASESGSVRAGDGWTDLMILPGRRFRVVDALITNFHLPHSTLLALVMAFAGAELTRRAYRVAVEERYRFFSYGDAMLVV